MHRLPSQLLLLHLSQLPKRRGGNNVFRVELSVQQQFAMWWRANLRFEAQPGRHNGHRDSVCAKQLLHVGGSGLESPDVRTSLRQCRRTRGGNDSSAA